MDETEDNIFHILLATDIHLGFEETNTIRENDTFATFEEILQIAVRENVDMILLGGDLFHETRPSPYSIKRCIELIKKYCLGDRPVEIEFISDPSLHFQQNPFVNYEDPNINISYPIFTIHGNHDDPTGKKQVSAMDLLSSMSLINYFGRWNDVTNVEINPILLKKGDTKLALYGLSHIRDERLARLFLDKRVTIKTPENVNDWFNVFVLHQNRANRGAKNFIAETFIPDFIDLVMWGHEHDCRIEPTPAADGRAYITQPGSSVATSLAEGEAVVKKIGLLRVSGKNFNILPIELQTVRPFIFNCMTLNPPQNYEGKVTHADRAKETVKKEIEKMITEAKNLKRKNSLPLIRLIVKYQDERQVFNVIRFGQSFVDKVANPEDIVKFSSNQKRGKRTDNLKVDNNDDDLDGEQIEQVGDLVAQYFSENNKLKVLSVSGLNEAVKRVIDSNDLEALPLIISNQEEYTFKKLLELQPAEDEVDASLERLKDIRTVDEFRKVFNDPKRSKPKVASDDASMTIDSDSESDASSASLTSSRGRGSRGGRGGKERGRGRGKK